MGPFGVPQRVPEKMIENVRTGEIQPNPTRPAMAGTRGNQMDHAISVEPFDGEYWDAFAKAWRPCQVVGVTADLNGKFIIIAEDSDGELWTRTMQAVRRKPPFHFRKVAA
jgi:hypothetical protein